MKRIYILVILIAAILFNMVGCGSRSASNDGTKAADNPGSAAASSSVSTSASTAVPGSSETTAETTTGSAAQNILKVVLYFPDEQGMYVVREEREIKLAEGDAAKLSVPEKARLCIDELMKGPQDSKLSKTSIPGKSKVNSIVLDNDNITVDFSQEFEKDQIGGSTGIMMAMAPLVLTLTELDGVKQVSIKVDGRVLDDFKGEMSLESPLQRSEYEQYIAK